MGMLITGEPVDVEVRDFMENACTFPSVLLWNLNYFKK